MLTLDQLRERITLPNAAERMGLTKVSDNGEQQLWKRAHAERPEISIGVKFDVWRDRDNQNGGNNQLVPYQSWNIELQANRNFGEWLSLQFDVRQAWFEDFIDWFPLPGDGEARGNIGSAQRLHLGLDATVRTDPIGWNGARFDVRLRSRDMDVIDPFTAEKRPFSGDTIDLVDVDFRYDIPQSDWAWGASLYSEGKAPYSRRYEFGREWEGPTFANLFVEHKDVFGLTVEGSIGNVLGARDRFYRTVYDTPRPEGQIAFSEMRDRRIGPSFQMSISGSL